jgi:hypothetical protein
MRFGNKVILIVGAIVVIILLLPSCGSPTKQWSEESLGREFERQGLI